MASRQDVWAVVVIVVVLVVCLSSCASRADRQAQDAYEAAQAAFARGEHADVIAKTTEALQLTDGGKETLTRKFDFYNGKVAFLRGQSYEASGEYEKALADYDMAIQQGNKFLTSYGLKSDPEWGAERKFREQLAAYNQRRAALLAKMPR